MTPAIGLFPKPYTYVVVLLANRSASFFGQKNLSQPSHPVGQSLMDTKNKHILTMFDC